MRLDGFPFLLAELMNHAQYLAALPCFPLSPKKEALPVLSLGLLIVLPSSPVGLRAKGVVDGQDEG